MAHPDSSLIAITRFSHDAFVPVILQEMTKSCPQNENNDKIMPPSSKLGVLSLYTCSEMPLSLIVHVTELTNMSTVSSCRPATASRQFLTGSGRANPSVSGPQQWSPPVPTANRRRCGPRYVFRESKYLKL
jgi:hypothetical protein